MIRQLLLALSLTACSVDRVGEAPQDSGVEPPDDGVVDAALPQKECSSMGNLPFSRSKTYVDGDPVDPQILGELQDMIIGAKRAEWPGYVTVAPYFSAGWSTPSGGTGVYCQSTNATNNAWFKLETEGGDQLRGIRFDAYGASSGTLQVQVFYGTVASGVSAGAFLGTQVIPNGVWTAYRADGVITFGGASFFSQPTMDDTNIAVVEFNASTVGMRIGNVRPILARP